jgi:hypothetical protein
MPGLPKKSLEFALLLILAHFNARLYRPCEPGMAQTQKPFKPVGNMRLLHTRSAIELVGTRKFELLLTLRTVIASDCLNAIFGAILIDLLQIPCCPLRGTIIQ